MPTGGYPMHLLTSIQGTDVALHAQGYEVHLLQRREREATDREHRRPTRDDRGALTRDQVSALLYHLAYWSGVVKHDDLRSLSAALFQGRRISTLPGCTYDY